MAPERQRGGELGVSRRRASAIWRVTWSSWANLTRS